MDVLMLVATDVQHDTRVLREARALVAAGHSVEIVGRDVPEGWTPPPGVQATSVSGGSGLRPEGSPGARRRSAVLERLPPARLARWLLLPRHRRRVAQTWEAGVSELLADRKAPDVVHAHDFSALPVGASAAEAWGSRLVYDSHEWWSGRQRHGRPAVAERRRDLAREAELTARAAAVLTVSDGIAERLDVWARTPVTVVRNTFPALEAPDPRCRPEPDPSTGRQQHRAVHGVVYAGRIGPGRDLETVLGGGRGLGLETFLIGPADSGYRARLRRAARRATVLPARDVDELDDVLRRVGIAVVTLTDSCENHRLALPNKLFHAVRAGVPVVAADLPELAAVVTRYGLGELYRPGDVRSYRRAVRRVRANHRELTGRVEAARAELNWEHDAARLVNVYRALAPR